MSRALVRDLLIVASIAVAVWVAYRLERIVFVLILAMFFAYVIAPLVERAERPVSLRGRSRRLPRAGAIALIYLLLAGTTAAGLTLLWPTAAEQLNAAVLSVPASTDAFRTWERGWVRYYERLRIPPEFRHRIDQAALDAGDRTEAYAYEGASAAAGGMSLLPWIVLVPILAFLLLKDAARIRMAALTALPHALQLRAHHLFEELNTTLAAYVRAQLLASLGVGVACGIGFALLGHSYAILLGVFAAACEFIPLVGPLVVAVVAVVIAALNDPMMAVKTAAFLATLRMVQDYVVYPRLIGRDIHLHPLAVILAVLAGVELNGVAGIFMAVPVLALATVGWRHGRAWYAECAVLDSPSQPSRVA